MAVAPSILSGARQIVGQCLGLEPNQELVILVDETTVAPGIAIAEAAESLGVSHTILLVPLTIQRRIPSQTDLSFLSQGTVREARAILSCLNSAPESLPFRRRILETHWTARTRIGHMPGASLDVLKLADVDHDQLVRDCWCLEIAMARGRTLELRSFDADGRQYCLVADIGGWDRLPVASDGMIRDGAWGNVPSGETYIAPMEGTAEGQVLINGSIPGLVLDQMDGLLLSFELGRLVRVEPEDGAAAMWLQESQIAKAQASGDLNWSSLAEIGVGVNPAVHELTGNMIFDEKAIGTAHIALGANTFMGGLVEASIHCDLIVRQPTILIDGKMVVDRGSLRYREAEWHENYGAVPLEESPLGAGTRVARSGVQAGRADDGRLQRILRPEPGRVSSCFVGDAQTAQFAQSLYRLIPAEGEGLSVESLAALANLDVEVARRVLHVLWYYDLVRVR